MEWPPKVGDLLPQADRPVGVRYKLETYSLDLDHREGGPKAHGFLSILGISLSSLDYLEEQICLGILDTPISAIRDNPPHGFNCVVDFPIQVLGERSMVVSRLRTIWILSSSNSRPRLLSALLKP